MARRGWALAVAAATVVAWLQLNGVPWAARAWAAVLLVPLPALMVLQARLLLHDTDELPRRAAYLSSIISLWVLAGATAVVARASGFGATELGLGEVPVTTVVVAGIALAAAGVALLFLFRLLGFREAAVLRTLLPQTADERLLFVAVSATAGICEEFIFRAFLLPVLTAATGSIALALLLSSGAFGVLHAYQRPIGALRAALLGALLAVPVLLFGSIYPAILAHTLIDVLAGLWLARFLLR